MTTTIIIFIVFCIIVLFYGIISYNNSKDQQVLMIEAGPTDCANEACLQDHYTTPIKTIELPNGEFKSSRDFIRIKISGNCMQKRNIFYGEEWLVKPINHTKPVQEQLNPTDILLIYIKDKNIYKIRELAGFLGNNMLETIYYKGDEVVTSSSPHSYDSILGIVKYNI